MPLFFGQAVFTNNFVFGDVLYSLKRQISLKSFIREKKKTPFKPGRRANSPTQQIAGEAAGVLLLDDIILNVQPDWT